MSTLRVSKISGRKESVGTKFTINNDSTYVEGNSGKAFTSTPPTAGVLAANTGIVPKGNFTQGALKGFCARYDMSDDSTGTTLNVSSVLDVSRGRVRYNHTNAFVAQKGYTLMPNDPSTDTKGFIYADPGSLATTTTADSFLLNAADNAVIDKIHSCGFGGELA